MGTVKEKTLRTEWFQQNQEIFRRYTIVDISLNKNIVTEVQSVFLSPLVDQLTGFIQVTAIRMLHYGFNAYVAIDKTDLEETRYI